MFQNPLRSIILAVAVLLLFSALPAFSATLVVTNTNDSGDGSLRAAISAAASGDTIEFSPAITYPATITLTSGQLNIDKSLTIVGPGAAKLTIDGDNVSMVFYIRSSSAITVSISALTIADGNAVAAGGVYIGVYEEPPTVTLTDCTISDNSAPGLASGGGIYNLGGALTLTGSTVSGNSDSGYDSGGGIYSSHGTVTLINSTVSGNSDSGLVGAGGIYNQSSTLTITGSTISGNSASGTYSKGGGIYSAPLGTGESTVPSTATITDSTISGNSADSGGGIFSGGSADVGCTVTLSNSTVSGNSASYGGGVYNSTNGTVTITNATISGNSDLGYPGRGGGIYDGGGTVKISNSTVSGNSASNFAGDGSIFSDTDSILEIKNTILAKGVGYNCFKNAGGVFTSLGYNLSDDDTCLFYGITNKTGDLNSTSAGLSTAGLQDNGGPTKTIALLSGSAAVDHIPETACTDADGNPVDYDQRGIPRPQGDGCDIGAYELEESTPFTPLSFSILKLNIRAESILPPRPPSFDLTSMFTLGAGTNGIDPLTEAVYLEVGEPGAYSVTIPAGSFKQLAKGKKAGSYTFSGVIDGVSLSVQITPLAFDTYEFKANGSGSSADLTELANPVTVTVSIGDDIGTKTDVNAKFLP